ncbi:MAG: NAD-dependent epimerase/dehydratase family protein [Candidatus Azambacteria bacterium GW2011_GWA1_44_9]|uniref:NAD-dependent epimerase/dehydratase family protein n=1 Tax=Candidatus Azambacteria bacterium GW2011_GWA1_44_9 TaxID=1618610 RepID=A0A0G1KCI8_9BACT|nr:MAG: NAD-dependent epimerase/dehydratase family protein [Candidatus Azambacteria bacterium GW2011_GWA1_44_9]
MKSRVLVTGGAGFIGSHTCDELLKKGYEVAVLDNLCEPVHDGSGRWPKYLDRRVTKIKGDVTNKKDWRRALKGVSYVVHLAAYQDLVPNFSRFFETNAVGTANLFELIVEKKLAIKKVVVASSQFVYGEGKYECRKHGMVFPQGREEKDLQRGKWEPVCPTCGGWISRLDLTEDGHDPRNQYSISKYTQELIGLRLGKLYNIPTVAMRYSIVQGARQSYRNSYSGVLRLFVTRMKLGIAPVIFEDGGQLRDYVSVKDVARANVMMLENDARYEAFNVGGGKAISVLKFANTVQKIVGTKTGYKLAGEYRVGDTRHSVSDIAKIRKWGWKPEGNIEESIREYYAWIKDVKIDRAKLIAADKKMRKVGMVRKARG